MINNYSYPSAVASRGGKYMISLSAANREAAGVAGGDSVEVTLEHDIEARTVELPEDLKAALSKAELLAAFESTASSVRKEFVRQVEDAKTTETRERRIMKIVEKLAG